MSLTRVQAHTNKNESTQLEVDTATAAEADLAKIIRGLLLEATALDHIKEYAAAVKIASTALDLAKGIDKSHELYVEIYCECLIHIAYSHLQLHELVKAKRAVEKGLKALTRFDNQHLHTSSQFTQLMKLHESC